jgi:16S rRNA G1207 methylase RsmC
VEHYFSAKPASADERREISVTLDGRAFSLETAPGVFSPGHIDLGTTVLVDTVGAPPAGDVLDLGCGSGPIEKIRSAIGKHPRKRSAHCFNVKHKDIRLDV